jgi:hypothetical protein
MRESLVLRTLRERPVSHIDFDRHERYTPVLDGDDFETIRQHLSLDASLELGALCDERRGECAREQRDER